MNEFWTTVVFLYPIVAFSVWSWFLLKGDFDTALFRGLFWPVDFVRAIYRSFKHWRKS